jgi:hypothetical protein
MRNCQVLGRWQLKRESATTGRLYIYIKGTAERGGDPLDHGEAEANSRMPRIRLLGAIEWLEKMGKIFGRDTAALILDRKNDNAELNLHHPVTGSAITLVVSRLQSSF